jgi:DNA-binding MarR family transcriptional regulator
MFYLRDLPKHETLLSHSRRYPNVAPTACEAFLVLLRVASDVLSRKEEHLQEHGISQGRFTVLMILNRNPEVGLSPSDLAQRAGVTRATMTGLLDGLEREGLVTRSGHPQDRRMLTVRLTEAGMRRLDQMLPEYFRRIGVLMGDMDEPEQRLFIDMLRRIESRLPELAETKLGSTG